MLGDEHLRDLGAVILAPACDCHIEQSVTEG
jgi:hypothetical protein